MNISSVVVSTRPEDTDRVATCLAGLPGVEIHAATAGRLAATLEDSTHATAGDMYVHLHTLPGVQSVCLIYQYSDEFNSEELPS